MTFEGDEKTSSTDEDYVSASTPYEDRPKIRDEDHLKRMYPECVGKTSTGGFSVTMKLHHNENAEPRIHAPRRLAIEKMESTKESLEQMVQDGIIVIIPMNKW